MVFRYSPDDMDRLIVGVPLEHEYTRAFWIVRIIFHNDGISDPLYQFSSQETILRKFTVPVV